MKGMANCATTSTHRCCEAFVVSFEVLEPALEHARLHHQDNPVWIVKGSTIGVDQMAMKTCRPRYVALHDTGTCRTRKVEKFITKQKPELLELIASGKDAVPRCYWRTLVPYYCPYTEALLIARATIEVYRCYRLWRPQGRA